VICRTLVVNATDLTRNLWEKNMYNTLQSAHVRVRVRVRWCVCVCACAVVSV
jgi:hypothetical protein